MLAKNIKKQILKRIKEKNLSILALDEKAGLSKGVRNIVSSKSVNPTIETVHAIAKALGCTINDLIVNPDDEQMQREQEECKFTEALFQDIVQKIVDCLKEKKKTLTISQVISIAKEAYIYFFAKESKVADIAIIEWLIDKSQ